MSGRTLAGLGLFGLLPWRNARHSNKRSEYSTYIPSRCVTFHFSVKIYFSFFRLHEMIRYIFHFLRFRMLYSPLVSVHTYIGSDRIPTQSWSISSRVRCSDSPLNKHNAFPLNPLHSCRRIDGEPVLGQKVREERSYVSPPEEPTAEGKCQAPMECFKNFIAYPFIVRAL